MRIVVVKFIFLILLTIPCLSTGADCPANWFDCGNGKCIAEIWHCDGDNDCGNSKDEHECENSPFESSCLSSQFQCESDNHCIPERWHCDGDKDCDDNSDEIRCDNVTEECTGFRCRDNHCIPLKWHCDGHKDCRDGSDEELCTPGKLCTDLEFLCSSGSCINQSLVCDKKKDCADGSDEGSHCGDPCENSTCSQNCRSTPAGPQCYCNDGYLLDANDNKTCLDVNECLKEGFCSHECTNTAGSYKCSCQTGYDLVNRTCKAKGVDPLLIFTTLKEIRGMRLRSGQYFLVRRAINNALAVDVDPRSQRIYWIEISNQSSVSSAKMDGRGLRTVLSHGLLLPEDIAVDYVANNIYLTDSGLKQILACKMDGRMCSVLHDKNVGKPRSIALDPKEGFVYWSDWGEQTAGIYKSGMDGSRLVHLVSSGIAWPNGIAIDHSTNRLYWADAKLNTIEYVSLDGTSRKAILNTTVFHPYSLAVFEDTLYWTDWTTFSLESCNKFTGHKMELLARENGKHMIGVHVYHPVLMATVSNPCWSSGCSHMCLVSPVSGFACACPHGFQLGRDGKTCTMEENAASIFVSEGSSVFYIRPKAVGSDTITELPLPLTSTNINRASYDKSLHYLFVADINSPAIYAVNMTSLNMRILVRQHISTPEDLSFDWRSNNLYWADSGKGTVEVISVDSLKRAVVLENLNRPVALAISPENGIMFVATVGTIQGYVKMYGMDGKNERILHSVQGLPMSIALHPSESFLYWADPQSGTISYVDYKTSRSARLLVSRIDGVMSVAVSEDCIFWTATRRELNLLRANLTHTLQLPGEEKGTVMRKVTYSPGSMRAAKSACLIGNGGCSYLCLTSPNGRTCTCPSELVIDTDNVTCVAKRCEANDFKCMNGRCIPPGLRCDGTKDCEDGSDEVGCGTRCSGDDFQCKNGRCILKSWRCDQRNDCIDNSDEEDCMVPVCSKEQIACLNGECVPVIWRCDGQKDCADGTDEVNCNATRCDSDGHHRCDSGQCIPISWLCDGSTDCYDDSDEKNCSKKACSLHEFTCESDESCIDELLMCDGKRDCGDGSDEKNCPNSHPDDCKKGMHLCSDGTCIYDYEICDGHNDCSNNEDERNCSHTLCQPDEMHCPSSKRCISRRWICDGDPDCSDESDEENCVEPKTHAPKPTAPVTDSTCDNFYCHSTGQCLSWSVVCDGRQDCHHVTDEGGLCSKACSGDNGGCSHICRKTPYGSQCECHKGYGLLPDNKTCHDIDECSAYGTCSHYCNNTRGGFKCSCADGYVLHDHTQCKAEGGPATLVYLLGDEIRGFNLHSHRKHVIVDVKIADMKGMDYDATEGIFFWTEKNDGTVNMYSLKTNKTDFFTRSSLRPTYIRYDWIAQNLYLKDESSSIVACTRDGRFCKTVINPDLTLIDSMDIAPTKGFIFWTVWRNDRRKRYSGLIERSEMDGSHRMVIVSEKTNTPTAVTVDHVLEKIYWSDSQLNTLESTDLHGFGRRQIIQSNMYHPLAVAVFEDNVYWADWGTDRIMRCNKFTGKDCNETIRENTKTHVLLIVHKAMQPPGINRCLNNNCSQLCLLTRSSHVCACDETQDDTCDMELVTVVPLPVAKCPKDFCHGSGECIVQNGKYSCKCSPPYSGETCEVKAAVTEHKRDYRWIIAVLLSIVVTGIIIVAILMYMRNRDKFHRVGESVSVKFRNPKSGHDGRLVMDTDDANVYDELVLGQEGDYKQAKGNSDYSPSETEEGDLNRWQSFGREGLPFNKNIASFFRKLKLNSSML